MRWLLMMSRWARNPPSDRRVALVFGAVALALVIWGIETLGYWPDWATAERVRMR
ncbi:MAG: hypothetical protein AAGM84_09460 [Pseudomonadota bacterium]